jgi:hypothetical protein
MKNKSKFNLWIWLGMVVGLMSCEKMNDLHDKYLQKGEITYLSRIDEVKILPGNQRAKLHYTNKDPKAHTLTVYWRSKADSLVFPIPENKVGEVLEIELPNLPEDFLTFQLVTKAANGDKSLPKELSARIYGDKYRASLTNRLIKSAVYLKNANELKVEWGTSLENAVNIQLSYDATDGKSRQLDVPIEEQSIVYLNMFKENLSYRTGYLPVQNAIDTFYTTPVDLLYSEPYVIEGLAFNGTNQYMRIPNHPDFNINSGEVLSVSMWIKSSVGNRTQRVLARRYNSGDVDNGPTGYGIALLNPSRTYVDWNYNPPSGGGGNSNVLPSSSTYVLDQWFHVTAVWDVANKNLSLYQDGILLGSKAHATVMSISSISDVYIGWWKTSPTLNPGEYFSGEIADLRFWKKALTPQEIQVTMTSRVTPNTNGLIAAYDLSNVQGTGTNLTIPDITGNHPALLHGYNKP